MWPRPLEPVSLCRGARCADQQSGPWKDPGTWTSLMRWVEGLTGARGGTRLVDLTLTVLLVQKVTYEIRWSIFGSGKSAI